MQSMRFLFKEEPDIVKMLGFTAVSRFFVMGITMVGLPAALRGLSEMKSTQEQWYS